MRHLFGAIVAAIEAAAIALVSFAFIMLSAVLIWLLPLQLGPEFKTVAQAAAQVWSLAHGNALPITVTKNFAEMLGVAEGYSFLISLTPLAISFVTVFLGLNLVRRTPESLVSQILMVLFAVAGFGAGAFVIIWGGSFFAKPPAISAVITAQMWFAVPAIIALIRKNYETVAFKMRWRSLTTFVQTVLPRALRLAAAAALVLLGLAAIAFALRLALTYPEIIRLMQALQLDAFGLIVVTVISLAYLPVALIWSLSWLSGAGFMIGTNTSVSPFETTLGPLPAFPLFATVPNVSGNLGPIALVIVFLAVVAVGALFGGLSEFRNPGVATTAQVIIVAAVTVGTFAALLGIVSSGSIGPGRMQTTGVDPLLFGGLISLETLIGLTVGILLRRAPAGVTKITSLTRGDAAVADDETELVSLENEEATGLKEGSRIADPRDQLTKPLFRKTSGTKPAAPIFDADELVEEFSWESIVEDPEK